MNTIQRLLALAEMGIRKTTQRDERRRRVLVDERILTTSREDPARISHPRSSGRTRRYAEAALVDRQPRICSFVPIRPWTVSIWFLAGLSFVTAHATAFALLVRYGPVGIPLDLAPINLTGPRALANWSSSLMLILAAALSALTVQFRQHRIDDYRGEYRVWYYVIAGMVIASIDASIGGHQILFQAARYAAAHYEIRHASLWINGLLSICVTGVCVRMVLEIRSSRGTLLTGMLAGAAYLCHMLLTTGNYRLPSADLHALTVGLARLAGHYLLVMSLVIYSRYVVLDAQGLISHAKKKKKKSSRQERPASVKADEQSTSQTKPKPSASPTITQGSQHQPSDGTKLAERPSQRGDSAESRVDEGPATLKLTKAERRKMRRQKRRERRAA